MSARIWLASGVTYLVVALTFYDVAREEGWYWFLAPLVVLVPIAFVVGMVWMWVWALA